MSGKYLLDTNIIISLFGDDVEIVAKVAKLDEIFIPVPVVGELFFGAQKSLHVEDNIQRINELVESSTVLECTIETAQHYGIIKKMLKDKGRPIPENDIWIAAIAREHGLILVSQDGHFTHVDMIEMEKW